MNRRNLSCTVIALLLLLPRVYPQAPDAAAAVTPDVVPAKSAKPQFFAGLVLEADAAHVKVSRNLVGRPTETRVFTVDAKTKTPKGGIKPKTRVTVRYQHLAEHDMALEIQIRPLSRTPKTS